MQQVEIAADVTAHEQPIDLGRFGQADLAALESLLKIGHGDQIDGEIIAAPQLPAEVQA